MENNKNKSNELVKTDKKIYRVYDKKDMVAAKKGEIPSTKCKHTRLAYLDKSDPVCPLSELKEVYHDY